MGYDANETNWECYSRKGDSEYVSSNGNLASPSITPIPLSLERKLLDNRESLYHDSLTERIDY